MNHAIRTIGLCLLLAFLGMPSVHSAETSGRLRWWKGNLHTHSLWSDGDDYPEMIAGWYRDHGYHFLSVTDHNLMQAGERWFSVTNRRGAGLVLERYRATWGDAWVQRRLRGAGEEVRLRGLDEYRGFLEEPGRFLLIAGEEITDNYLNAPLHMNAHNLVRPIKARGGSNVLEVLQRNTDAVLAQRTESGQPMFPHINHPNFGWGITAEDLMQVRGERFFEVYNGHPSVHNEGDAGHPSIERMWDIALTWRLAFLGLGPLYGMAVDDGHNYHAWSVEQSNPGRGWVQVRSRRLDAASILAAMEAGDFYASSGVELKEVERSKDRLRVEIDARPGVLYRVEFIGTRRGFNARSEPLTSPGGLPLRVSHRYSPDVGAVLAVVDGPRAEYRVRGDELYVRARISSSRPKENPGRRGEMEMAWTQPWVSPVAGP
jgi:hypothetical protein